MSSSNPSISIIVPVYNCSSYLKSCISSILSQSFTNFELILVNDGSTDDSEKICLAFAEKDQRILVISKNNGGVSSARNVGIKVSSGKYLMFVDGDDTVSPHLCEKLLSYMEQSESSLAICGYRFINEIYQTCTDILPNVVSFTEIKPFKDYYVNLFQNRIYLSVWGKLFLSDLIRAKNIYFDESISLGEDFLFLHTYFKYIDKFSISIVNESLYNYYVHTIGLSKSTSISRIAKTCVLYQHAKELYTSLNMYEIGMYCFSTYYMRTLSIIFNSLNLNSNKTREIFLKTCVLTETKEALSFINKKSPEGLLYFLTFHFHCLFMLRLMLIMRKIKIYFRDSNNLIKRYHMH